MLYIYLLVNFWISGAQFSKLSSQDYNFYYLVQIIVQCSGNVSLSRTLLFSSLISENSTRQGGEWVQQFNEILWYHCLHEFNNFLGELDIFGEKTLEFFE